MKEDLKISKVNITATTMINLKKKLKKTSNKEKTLQLYNKTLKGEYLNNQHFFYKASSEDDIQ